MLVFLGNLFCIVLINLKTGFCIDNDFIVSKEVACQSALGMRVTLCLCPVLWRVLRRRKKNELDLLQFYAPLTRRDGCVQDPDRI